MRNILFINSCQNLLISQDVIDEIILKGKQRRLNVFFCKTKEEVDQYLNDQIKLIIMSDIVIHHRHNLSLINYMVNYFKDKPTVPIILYVENRVKNFVEYVENIRQRLNIWFIVDIYDHQKTLSIDELMDLAQKCLK